MMHDLQRYLVEEFADEYQHGALSRRELLRKVLLVTGSVAVTATALSALGVPAREAEAVGQRFPTSTRSIAAPRRIDDPAQSRPSDPPPMQTNADVIDPNDPDITAGMVQFGGAAGDLFGYLAQPSAEGTYAGIVIVHENRGLIEPNMDIARRYAKEGYAALAVDLVSRAGGTQQFLADLAQASGFLGQANPDDLVSDLISGLSYLAGMPSVDGNRLGATGFCFGGGLTWRLATAAENLKAVVPYYGPNPPLDRVPNVTASAFAIYAELDTRITGASPDLDAALDAAGVVHMKWIAPNANHAFFNNTGQAYNPTAALEAWHRTLDWFATYL